MAQKKASWTDLLGTGGNSNDTKDDVEETGPTEPPVTVLMHTIVQNPDNPRTEDDYTDEDEEFAELKESMREVGQLQSLTAVSAAVYLRLKPERAGAIGDADWVVVTGNRRLAAARQLGWTRVDVRVQDHLGDDKGKIDEAVVIENIHRKNIAPIKEAAFLQRMVEKHGSQDAVAKRIGKSQMYVSHRLSLLKLAPDVQEQVDAGKLKIKAARQIASETTDPEEQRVRAEKAQQEAAKPKPPRKPKSAPAQNPVLKSPGDQPQASDAGAVQNPVLETTTSRAEPAKPGEPQNPVLKETSASSEGPPEVSVEWMPWHNPTGVLRILRDHMAPADFEQLVKEAQAQL